MCEVDIKDHKVKMTRLALQALAILALRCPVTASQIRPPVLAYSVVWKPSLGHSWAKCLETSPCFLLFLRDHNLYCLMSSVSKTVFSNAVSFCCYSWEHKSGPDSILAPYLFFISHPVGVHSNLTQYYFPGDTISESSISHSMVLSDCLLLGDGICGKLSDCHRYQ